MPRDDSDVSDMDTSSVDELGPEFDKGLMALQNKDYEEAINHFSRSLEKNEEDEDIAYNLACCFSRIKDVNQGIYWLDRAISWGLSEGSPEKDSDLAFLKSKDKARFSALVLKFKNPSAAAADIPKIEVRAPSLAAPAKSAAAAESVTLSRSKRAVAGQRMSQLVGEEADADADFWDQDAWNADDVDEEFSGEDAQEKLDIFDSDFNDSEDANDEVYDDEGIDKQRKSRVQKQGAAGSKRGSSAYKDPYQLKQKAKQRKLLQQLEKDKAGGAAPRKAVPLDKATKNAILAAAAADRSKRSSTKLKTATAEQIRLEQSRHAMQFAKRSVKKEVLRHTQQELLAQAIETEVVNQQSLEKMQRIEEEKKASNLPKLPYQGPIVRYHSKKDMPNTITFTAVDDFPAVINSVAPPYPLKATCEVTGLVAKYKDPLTGKPYATLAAFKTIRARHRKEMKAKEKAAQAEAPVSYSVGTGPGNQ